ncbi:MAG: type II toxin-antitoxin system RelB/DinJ family antitoxin [Rickettsiales bacterium]|jgi:addiction module RelB/DinJ family antitoxin|nr:type II toxin-antitoxin system RelB/DinJ family antitoxin [Rickettsiales bacterium]
MNTPEMSVIQTRVPVKVRRSFESVSERIGIRPTDAIRILMNKYIDYNGFPFEVAAQREEIPNAETRAAFEAFERGDRTGFKSFKTSDEFRKYVESL